jgi:uncharacterized cupin superfamily protein
MNRSTGPNSAPLGDETAALLEGSATITVTKTGKQYRIEPGSIMSHPKGLDITWEIDGPYLRKFWVIWDSPHIASPRDDLYIGNISDDATQWEPYGWTEPVEGEQECGELYVVRPEGATGTLMAGVWRSAIGMPGCAPDGGATVPYTAPLGDETMLLLEGQVHVRNEETGEEYDFRAGDVIGMSTGLRQTWTSRGPFVKKFWVITNENPPA